MHKIKRQLVLVPEQDARIKDDFGTLRKAQRAFIAEPGDAAPGGLTQGILLEHPGSPAITPMGRPGL